MFIFINFPSVFIYPGRTLKNLLFLMMTRETSHEDKRREKSEKNKLINQFQLINRRP